MKTAYKKRPSNTTEPKQDKFISKILENLDKVNASDWERYTNLEGSYPCNLFTGQNYKGFNIVAFFFRYNGLRFYFCKICHF